MSEFGTYTSIVGVSLPSSAKAGDTVHVAITIQNIWTSPVNIQAIINASAPINGANGSPTIVIGDQNVPLYGSYTYETDMVMPDQSVTLHIRSLVWDGTEYFDDADEYVGISLGTAPTPVQWQPLDEVAVAVPLAVSGGWQLLNEIAVVVPRDLSVVGGWRQLDEKTAFTGQGIDWSSFKLVEHADFPDTNTYKGAAQECDFYFEAPSILPSVPFAKDLLIDAFTFQLNTKNAAPLSIDIYQGSGSLLSSYIVKVVAYIKPSVYTNAVGFFGLDDGVAWTTIILAALIVLGIIAATFFVIKLIDLVWGPPGKQNAVATAIWPIAIGVVAIVGGILLLSGSKQKT
ncbi:MAG: hypothetical protein ABSF21_00355 [Dehalococcoidia bacterium]|jgi:hypothetical protein